MQLYELIASSLNWNQKHSPSKSSQFCLSEESPPTFKCLLPSSISSSQRSWQPKKERQALKNLKFCQNNIAHQRKEAYLIKGVIISTWMIWWEINTGQVKVDIVAPSSRVENHSSLDEKTKSMILMFEPDRDMAGQVGLPRDFQKHSGARTFWLIFFCFLLYLCM